MSLLIARASSIRCLPEVVVDGMDAVPLVRMLLFSNIRIPEKIGTGQAEEYESSLKFLMGGGMLCGRV